jgi:nucleoside 2-deoxyribosyltransferase
MVKKNIKIYLASPLGFSELSISAQNKLESILIKKGYKVLNPWKMADLKGFNKIKKLINEKERMRLLKKWNIETARKNAQAIVNSTMILAVLDGADVDSGTASEIGYGFGLGKLIYGIRADFRLSGDNIAATINIQVQYWIEKSGGMIFTSLDELKRFF